MTLTDEQLKDLEAKAKAATPGPWKSDHHGVFATHPVCRVGLTTGHYESEEMNRDFIAAANPAVVLALVERIRALQQEHEEDQGVIRVWRRRTTTVEADVALYFSPPPSTGCGSGRDDHDCQECRDSEARKVEWQNRRSEAEKRLRALAAEVYGP